MKRFTLHASRFIGGFIAVLVMFQGLGASALSVNPAIHDVTIDPGKVETRTITIENDEAIPQTYVVGIQKFIPKGELGQQEFLDPTDTEGLPEWMYVDKPEVTLAPGTQGTIQVAIRVPTNAPAGGYYAALFLSRKQLAQEQVAMLPRLGILFFVQVNGALTEKLSVRSFQTDADVTYEHLPVGFRTSIVNEGNVHLVPSGTIRIKNMLGATVASIPANAESSRVMPGSERVVSTSWSKGKLVEGSGFISGLMQELMHFGIGRYSATVRMEGRGFSQPVESTTHFMVWPWRTAVAFVVLVSLLVALFFAFKKLAIASATAKSTSEG
ncbi:hypothetical protein M0Q28_06605 [Patescibacteria group bacterium]|jgi:hypothetical protein|nr:hypothetical protein [Patescibacteria group bacterium]